MASWSNTHRQSSESGPEGSREGTTYPSAMGTRQNFQILEDAIANAKEPLLDLHGGLPPLPGLHSAAEHRMPVAQFALGEEPLHHRNAVAGSRAGRRPCLLVAGSDNLGRREFYTVTKGTKSGGDLKCQLATTSMRDPVGGSKGSGRGVRASDASEGQKSQKSERYSLVHIFSSPWCTGDRPHEAP